MRTNRRTAAVTGAIATLALTLAACGGAEQMSDQGGQPKQQAQQPTTQQPAGGMTDGVTTADDVFGPGCANVPTDPKNEGSVQGMINDPVGTAASNNPLLTKLTKAVQTAGLVDTLNKPDASYTVFAPADPAFEALPPETLRSLLEDPAKKQDLQSILTYHVVPKRMDAAGLVAARSVDTVQGGKVQIGGSPEAPTVNGAKVLCGNVPTANATVFVVDQVLQPAK